MNVCQVCGKEYNTPNKTSKYCPECRILVARITSREWALAREPREYVCEYCGKTFFKKHHVRFCGRKCQNAYTKHMKDLNIPHEETFDIALFYLYKRGLTLLECANDLFLHPHVLEAHYNERKQNEPHIYNALKNYWLSQRRAK